MKKLALPLTLTLGVIAQSNASAEQKTSDVENDFRQSVSTLVPGIDIANGDEIGQSVRGGSRDVNDVLRIGLLGKEDQMNAYRHPATWNWFQGMVTDGITR